LEEDVIPRRTQRVTGNSGDWVPEDWNTQDVAEYNDVKAVGILLAISPVITLLSALPLVWITGSYRVVTFVVGLAGLMGAGTGLAWYISRLWSIQLAPAPLAAPLIARRSRSKTRSNLQRQRLALRISSRHAFRAFASARSMSVLPMRLRSRAPALPLAPRLAA
jgi:hypothetical protein